MGLERQRWKSEAHGCLSALGGLLVHAFELVRSGQELSAFERSLCGNGIEALGDKKSSGCAKRGRTDLVVTLREEFG